MNKSYLVMGLILVVVLTIALPRFLAHAQNSSEDQIPGISAKVVADYIHAVIQADRTLYATHVVERMAEHKIVIAAEYWKQRKALPLPAQMLLLSGLQVEQQGTGLKFRLSSLVPIYEKNGPTTDFERAGLNAVTKDPSQPYTGVIQRGEQKFFKAVYADKAVSTSCINCHNGHLLSPKQDYQLGDVMGGVIISFPLQ